MENNILLNETDLEQVFGGAEGSSGLPCPQCGYKIPCTIQDIRSSDFIECPNCHLQIPIDRSRSNSAIDALRKVQEAQNAVGNN